MATLICPSRSKSFPLIVRHHLQTALSFREANGNSQRLFPFAKNGGKHERVPIHLNPGQNSTVWPFCVQIGLMQIEQKFSHRCLIICFREVMVVCKLQARLIIGLLTLKAPITAAADDIHKYFFIVFQRK